MSPDAERRARYLALVKDLAEPLERYVRRRALAADVPDVMNDILLVAWRRLEDIPQGQPLPYCYGIARRCLANHRRSSNRRFALLTRLRAQNRAHEPDPGAAVDASQPELAVALAALTDAERELVRLWAWERLEPREIAVVVDTTPNAVSVALSRARRKLALEMDRQDRDSAGHDHHEHGKRR